MKKNAWTLVEMVVALTVIILISGLCISAFRPGTQKNKLFIYAAMRNLVMGNVGVIDKYKKLDFTDDVKEVNGIEYDQYCLALADNFTLKSSPNCRRDAKLDDINFVFPNGVAVKGLASEWYEYPDHYTFKDILVDIDGSKGLNTLWVDQFPLRIYSGGEYEGIVWPVNCTSDADTEYADPAGRSDYCDRSETDKNETNFALDKKAITYNIYRAQSADDSDGKLVASNMSPMEADCTSYGGGGMYTTEQCTKQGFRVHENCVTTKICSKCSEDDENIKNICPEVNNATISKSACETMVLKNNPASQSCIVMQNKPRSGASIILETMVGDISSHFL